MKLNLEDKGLNLNIWQRYNLKAVAFKSEIGVCKKKKLYIEIFVLFFFVAHFFHSVFPKPMIT